VGAELGVVGELGSATGAEHRAKLRDQ
jgi:hypothetical protein